MAASGQVQALLDPNRPAEFEALLTALTTPDNQQRTAAEQALENVKPYPDQLSLQLATVLTSSNNEKAREMSAILLRQTAARDNGEAWKHVSGNTKDTVKAAALQTLEKEPSRWLTKPVCDLVGILSMRATAAEGWPQLLPWMFNAVRGSNELLRLHALQLFASTAESIFDAVKPYMGTLHTVIKESLEAKSSEVKITAFKAVVAFVSLLEDGDERQKFQDLVPLMVNSLGETLHGDDEDTAQDALAWFVQLAEDDPRFVRRHLSNVTNAMLHVLESEGLEAETRSMACEFLMTLLEAKDKAPGMMRKLPDFMSRFFAALMELLIDIDDHHDWYNASSSENASAGEGDLYETGLEALDRMALAVGGKTLLPIISSALPQYMASEDWRRRHAALMALAQVVEGCSKLMSKQTDQAVSPSLTLLSDSHPRVRYAAINCIGQMCTDLNGNLQAKEHQRVIPALLQGMGDTGCDRVRAHAASAVLNFSEDAEREHIQPYIEALMNKLVEMLNPQGNPPLVMESACSAIASLADTMQEGFSTYYDTLMPMLRSLVKQATGKQLQQLRAKAVECVSLLGLAVGKEKFQSDATAVMDMLMGVQQEATEDDDQMAESAMQAYTRICKTLGKDFVPYMNQILPKVLEVAAKDEESISAAASSTKRQQRGNKQQQQQPQQDEDNDEDDEDVVSMITSDRRVVQIRTSALEEKARGVSMLATFVAELQEHIFPYLEHVTNLATSLLQYEYHEEVRQGAAQMLPDLARAASASASAGQCSKEWAFEYGAKLLLPKCLEAAENESEPEVLSDMLEAAGGLIRECGDAAEPSTLDAGADRAIKAVEESASRRAERESRRNAEDFTEEDAELLEEEEEPDRELLDGVIDLLGSFARAFGQASWPLYQRKLQPLMQRASSGNHPEERRVAVCVMDDLLEHAPSAEYLRNFIPVLLECSRYSNTSLRQAACYGLGVACERMPDQFTPYAGDALAALAELTQAPDARDEEKGVATDNAASSLFRMLEAYPADKAPFSVDRCADALVAALPLRWDEDEIATIHFRLARAVERLDQSLLGQDCRRLPSVLSALAQILAEPSHLGGGEVVKGCRSALASLQSNLPQAASSAFSSLPSHLQVALQQPSQ